jgi:hypothetical protein
MEPSKKEKKSKITVFISAHASDFLKTPINGAIIIDGKYNIDQINTNIRMVSYAGKTCCVSFSKSKENSSTTIESLKSIKDNIQKFKDEQPENESTYDMLNYIANSQRESYKSDVFDDIPKHKSNAKTKISFFDFEKTEECLITNQHLQIVTPFIEQEFKFYDRLHSYTSPDHDSLGIYVLDIQNPPDPSTGKITLHPGNIIKDILEPTGKTKFLSFGSLYEDYNESKHEIEERFPQTNFNPKIEVKKIRLSRLIDYLTQDCGFEIVNIIHKACRAFRTEDFFTPTVSPTVNPTLIIEKVIPYMNDINEKEIETRNRIDKSFGGKTKTKNNKKNIHHKKNQKNITKKKVKISKHRKCKKV